MLKHATREMLILYHGSNSYASQKVRLYLAEHSIPWESHHIDLLKQEHLTEAYIKINPRGLVPALVDNGKIILNSTDIMSYLEEHYVKSASLSKELQQQIYNFCKRDEGLHDPHIRTLSYHYRWMNKNQTPMEINRVLELAKKHPDKARGIFLARAIQRQLTTEEIALAKTEIMAALKEMEQRLQNSQSGFLFAEQCTMADAAGTARLFRLQLLGFETEMRQYPLTFAYYERMQQRPSSHAIHSS